MFQRYVEREEFNRWHLLLDDPRLGFASGRAIFAQTHLAPVTVPRLPNEVKGVIERAGGIAFAIVPVFSPGLFFAIITRLRYNPPNQQPANHAQPDRAALSSLILAVCRPVDRPPLGEAMWRAFWDMPLRIQKPPQALIDFFNDPANGDGTNYEIYKLKELLLVSLGEVGIEINCPFSTRKPPTYALLRSQLVSAWTH